MKKFSLILVTMLAFSAIAHAEVVQRTDAEYETWYKTQKEYIDYKAKLEKMSIPDLETEVEKAHSRAKWRDFGSNVEQTIETVGGIGKFIGGVVNDATDKGRHFSEWKGRGPAGYRQMAAKRRPTDQRISLKGMINFHLVESVLEQKRAEAAKAALPPAGVNQGALKADVSGPATGSPASNGGKSVSTAIK